MAAEHTGTQHWGAHVCRDCWSASLAKAESFSSNERLYRKEIRQRRIKGKTPCLPLASTRVLIHRDISHTQSEFSHWETHEPSEWAINGQSIRVNNHDSMIECILFLQRTQVWFPETTLGDLQLPVTPAPGDLMPLSSLGTWPHVHTYTQPYTHAHVL